jgi:hypothetical protein
MAQERDTFTLNYEVSKNKMIIYKRVIDYNLTNRLNHVKDYFENGQIQMDAFFSAFDKHIKEESQCNYRSYKGGIIQRVVWQWSNCLCGQLQKWIA